ncbi:MAG: rhodanese-like domain-containing protein [Humibacter sp.]
MSTQTTTDAACALPDAGLQAGAASLAPQLVTANLASAAVAGGALLVDVRSAGNREQNGAIPGAVIADRTRIPEQFALDSHAALPGVTSHDRPIVVICGSVNGSLPVATELLALGFRNVVHFDGGFRAWKGAGLPTAPWTADTAAATRDALAS